jgi:hypothetical protein
MEAIAEIFAFVAGTPAMVGLILTAVIIFLTSDWRLSLTGLLVQYLLVGIAVTRFVQLEVALVKILVGVLAVSILYLSGRRIQEVQERQQPEATGTTFLGVHLAWGGGPLGLPLRLLVVLFALLAVVRFFGEFHSLLPALGPDFVTFPPDIALVSLWLGLMGLVGLVLSGNPLRVAPALLTLLAAFDLVHAGLEPSLAVVGFLGAFTLLLALAFSYLAIVQGLAAGLNPSETPHHAAGLPEERVEG